MQKDTTLLIPTFNRSDLLNKCLESVEMQTFNGNIHCIISNNNSPDNTDDVVYKWQRDSSKFNITYIKNEESLEPIENWIKTLSYIDTEYSKWLQDDDWLEPNAIETMMRDLNDYNPNGLIYNCNIYTKKGKIANYYKPPSKKLVREDVINHVLQLAPVFPVSPTASIFKSDYIQQAIEFGKENDICTKKLMGNDLVMNFFGIFNDLDTHYISNTLVNFYGGDDSISLVNNPKILSHCYLRSLGLMIDYDSTTISTKQKEIISHRYFATKVRGKITKEFNEISHVKGFNPKISFAETLKYIKKKIS